MQFNIDPLSHFRRQGKGLPAGGAANILVFGRIDSSLDIEQLRIAMAMQTVANRLPNGQLNYVFKPVD